jgi:large subunit ribosomal protein L23
METRAIIKRYLATEKSTVVKEAHGKYAFAVDLRATKPQIREAVEKLFKVHVESVRTVVVPGKIKRLGRNEGKTSRWKKAVITLKGDERITEFENL